MACVNPPHTANFPPSMRAYNNHRCRVTHMLLTINKYKCMCEVEHRVHRDGRTINQRLTMPTISQRGAILQTRANINSLSVEDVADCTPPFPSPVQVLFHGRSQYGISAVRFNMLRKQKRPIPHKNVIVYNW